MPSLKPRADVPSRPLSPRERSVLEILVEGATNKVIAQRLGLREQTVKNHLSSIFAKLGVANRLELVLHAMRQRDADQGGGIADPDAPA